MTQVKLRKVGNSIGCIFPKEVLDTNEFASGDVLTLVKTPAGIELQRPNKARLKKQTPNTASFDEKMEAAKAGMKKYHNTLHELAK